MQMERKLEEWARINLPIYDFMDLTVISVSDGFYQCSVPRSKNTTNHIKTIHAAFQWASAEILGGLVVLSTRASEKYVPVVKSLNIEFKRPALTDITSEAHFSREQVKMMNASMQSESRYDFELGCLIRDDHGDVVAEAIGQYAVRVFD